MKVVIVLGGVPPSNALLERQLKGADFSIAADAGMKAFANAGQMPDLLIGDFDSFDPEAARVICEVARVENQEQTDFQKALARPEVLTADEIVILGGTGGRSDHFLTNLLIAADLPAEIAVLFEAETEIMRRVTPERPLAWQGLVGQTVSLIPMGRCEGVTATGLRWPLTEVSMGPGEQLGQSNVAEAEEVCLSLKNGTLYAIVLKN